MIAPKTYVGYDQTGNRVATCTAANANDVISPADVQNALNNIRNVLDEHMKNICNSLTNVAPEAGAALVVEGTKMTEPIQELANELSKITESIMNNINGIYDESLTVHDKIQTQFSEDACNTVKRCEGVVSVR